MLKYRKLFPVLLIVLLAGCGDEGVEESSLDPVDSSEVAFSISGEESSSSTEVVSREETILAEMTLEEKVGQMFLARYPDVDSVYYASDYELGGYIWFAKDFESKDPALVNNEIAAIQDEMPIDLFMAVDEEGGDVVRISSFPQFRSAPFTTPRAAFDESGWDGVKAFALEQTTLLKQLGFNLNLAPIVDVASGPEDFIYHRAFSTDVAEVSQFAEVFVSAYNDANVGTVLKHFPGYGSNVDTHTGVAYDDRSLESLKERDLVPFQVGIDNGSEAVLVAHNVMEAIDPDWPATLSPSVIAILREDMGFEGIIMTDDLVMDGLQAFATPEEAAVLAVLAGNDVLISSDFMLQIPAVLSAVEDGRISEEMIDAAVLRILKTKIEMGIL